MIAARNKGRGGQMRLGSARLGGWMTLRSTGRVDRSLVDAACSAWRELCAGWGRRCAHGGTLTFGVGSRVSLYTLAIAVRQRALLCTAWDVAPGARAPVVCRPVRRLCATCARPRIVPGHNPGYTKARSWMGNGAPLYVRPAGPPHASVTRWSTLYVLRLRTSTLLVIPLYIMVCMDAWSKIALRNTILL